MAGLGSFTLWIANLTMSWIPLWISLRGITSKTSTPCPVILLFLEDTWPHLISTSFYIQAINCSLATAPVWFWSSEESHHSLLGSKIWWMLWKGSKSASCCIYISGLWPSSGHCTFMQRLPGFGKHSFVQDNESKGHPICNSWYWDFHIYNQSKKLKVKTTLWKR